MLALVHSILTISRPQLQRYSTVVYHYNDRNSETHFGLEPEIPVWMSSMPISDSPIPPHVIRHLSLRDPLLGPNFVTQHQSFRYQLLDLDVNSSR